MLASILAEIGNPQVDFFSRDVEGLELPLLQALDLSVTRPEFNLVEYWDKTGVRDFLTGKGYAVHTKISDKDTLFRLN